MENHGSTGEEPPQGGFGSGPLKVLGGVLLAQILLGGALVIWAASGFPLPDFLRGGHSAPTVATAATTSASSVPRARVDRFDGARAFALLRTQVEEYGPRPAGSPPSHRLAERLRAELPRGRFEAIPGQPGLRNVTGVLPGLKPAIVVGAHYDTEASVPDHVGANDGAAGTAAVVELARALKATHRSGDREVRFVLFDGEEEPKGSTDFYRDALRGSKAYAERHGDQTREMVLLDYIAEREGLRFPREASSDPRLWAQLRAAARSVGVGTLFPAAVSGQILDDHTPFLEAGVPAIDLIDFDYPQRDTPQDNLDAVSEASLDATGEAVFALIERRR
ncbi:MAG: Zn-dependent exopeptidase M28 [Solirubrobacteraceae bacterium]|nr:Zn-dependent exopeptidase M28 [Solirubrobacteraceae bacterium]